MEETTPTTEPAGPEASSPATPLLGSSPRSHDDLQTWIFWKRKIVEYYFRTRSALTALAVDEQGTGWTVVYGLVILAFIGMLLGAILPGDSSLPNPERYFSNAIGWTYFVGWSISFYPQVISNYRHKTTLGLSPDFCGLNVLGFACYATYNLGLYYSKTIQEEYRHRHGQDAVISVQSNDVAFAVHAFALASITFAQIGYYNGFRGTQSPSRVIQVVASLIVAAALSFPLLVLIFKKIEWLDYLYMLSYIKVGVTLMKYVPQVILNYQRQSTVGWSIWNIILDFTGGLLSNVQLVLDCAALGDFTGITGNLAKLALGSVSVVFDVIFMTQHYVLYPSNPDGEDDDDDNVDFVEGEPLAAIDDVTL